MTLMRSWLLTAILLLATVLPWALEEIRGTRTTGCLYGVNSLGAVVGSVRGAWVLLPSFGVARTA